MCAIHPHRRTFVDVEDDAAAFRLRVLAHTEGGQVVPYLQSAVVGDAPVVAFDDDVTEPCQYHCPGFVVARYDTVDFTHDALLVVERSISKSFRTVQKLYKVDE